MTESLFYDLVGLDQLAVNLFYGLGYNFYRRENQLRADDQRVRTYASSCLTRVRAQLERTQSTYRRTHLPPPSRAKPSPNPEAIEQARLLEAVCGRVGEIEGLIRSLPVPGNDRMTQRYRQEAETLVALAKCDQQLVGMAEVLRITMETRGHEWVVGNTAVLEVSLDALAHAIEERQRLLLL